MKLIVYDTHTFFEGNSTPSINLYEKNTLKSILRARPDGYQFMPKFKRKQWDGFITLVENNCFPSGLVEYLIAHKEAATINFEVEDRRKDAAIMAYDIEGVDYRPYQIKAIELGIKHKNCTFQMATNAGKTLVMAGLIKAIGDINLAIVIVPTVALLYQTSNDLEQLLGEKIGKFGDGHHDYRSVTVSTIDSLEALVPKVSDANLVVVIDECHHTGADSLFSNVIDIPGRYRFAMSGTPLTTKKLNDMRLWASAGKIVYKVTNAELIKWGYSTPPIIRWIKISNLDIPDDEDYQKAYKLGIVDNIVRNYKIADIAKKEIEKGPVIIIVEWIKHVKKIEAIFKTMGITPLIVTGKLKSSETMKRLAEFEKNGGVLLCTPVFGEGINLPSISTLIMGSGMKSHIMILQRIGRGLRKADGKEFVMIYDFLDDTHKTLFKHSESRMRLYKREKFTQEFIK